MDNPPVMFRSSIYLCNWWLIQSLNAGTLYAGCIEYYYELKDSFLQGKMPQVFSKRGEFETSHENEIHTFSNKKFLNNI